MRFHQTLITLQISDKTSIENHTMKVKLPKRITLDSVKKELIITRCDHSISIRSS